jgi:hypothetical protein
VPCNRPIPKWTHKKQPHEFILRVVAPKTTQPNPFFLAFSNLGMRFLLIQADHNELLPNQETPHSQANNLTNSPT